MCYRNYLLAAITIVIWMMVAPIPVGPLFFHFQFNKRVVLAMSLAEIHAKGAIFVVIPVVVVLMVAVEYPVAVIVAMMFFLASVVLGVGCRVHCRWRSEGCS